MSAFIVDPTETELPQLTIVEDFVPTPFEELAFNIAAIESAAVARFDAAIADLLRREIDEDSLFEPEDVVPVAVESDVAEPDVVETEVVTVAEAEPDAPRGGRHVSDEVSLSIYSFVGGRFPRHRAETVPDLYTLAS
jgi:hypothetical protein